MKLILFDIDGTLLTGKGLGRATKDLALRDLFGVHADVMSHPFGGKTDWQLLSELLATQERHDVDIAAIMPRYAERMAFHMTALLPNYTIIPCPFALEVVQILRPQDDVLLGNITGNTKGTAPIKLRAAGFDPAWFPVGAYGSEAYNRNDLPPLAIARAEESIGQTFAAKDVIVVGDTAMDVACAKVVGATSVAVRTGFASEQELQDAQPDYLLDDLSTFLTQVMDG